MNVSNYKTDIDYDLLATLDTAGVIKYAKEKFCLNTLPMPFEKVANMSLSACDVVGLKPDNEQLLFILADVKRCLCESCAGSGKTTMSQMSILKYKMIAKIPSSKILCIAYNNNAVHDMIDRHRDIVIRVNQMLRKVYDRMLANGKAAKPWSDVYLDTSLHCTTFHALCREWVVEYAHEFHINPETFLLADGQDLDIMETLLKQFVVKRKLQVKNTLQLAQELLRVYSFARETLSLTDPSQWTSILSDEDLKRISISQISEMFTIYDKAKVSRNKMDFADIVDAFYILLHKKEIMARVRENYSVILVDEYQDITPSMLRIIKLIAEGDGIDIPRYEDLRLICVGDTDQSIYGYRGTDPFNCMRFRDDYGGHSDTRVLSMSTNRRCGNGILDYARKIITSNKERIDKPILGLRDGGQVDVIDYSTQEEEMRRIVAILKSLPHDELGDTCICYRNNSSARFVGMMLLENQISARCLNARFEVFQDDVSRFVEAITNLFAFPRSKKYQKDLLPMLYKYVRQKAGELRDCIDIAPEDTPFWELNLNSLGKTKTNSDCIDTVYNCFKLHKKKAPLSEYMPVLLDLFKSSPRMSGKLNYMSLQDKEFFDYMLHWYSQDMSYTELMNTRRRMEEAVMTDQKLQNEVSLSTFHGLKGLEFKNVLIIDMADTIFPGSDINKNKKMTAAQLLLAQKEAIRLLYVAVTRAKDRLWVMFPTGNGGPQMINNKKNESLPSTFRKFFVTSSIVEQAGAILAASDVEGVTGTAPTKTERVVHGFVVDEIDTDQLEVPMETESDAGVVMPGSRDSAESGDRDVLWDGDDNRPPWEEAKPSVGAGEAPYPKNLPDLDGLSTASVSSRAKVSQVSPQAELSKIASQMAGPVVPDLVDLGVAMDVYTQSGRDIKAVDELLANRGVSGVVDKADLGLDVVGDLADLESMGSATSEDAGVPWFEDDTESAGTVADTAGAMMSSTEIAGLTGGSTGTEASRIQTEQLKRQGAKDLIESQIGVGQLGRVAKSPLDVEESAKRELREALSAQAGEVSVKAQQQLDMILRSVRKKSGSSLQ